MGAHHDEETREVVSRKNELRKLCVRMIVPCDQCDPDIYIVCVT